jgi:hypothetical protein
MTNIEKLLDAFDDCGEAAAFYSGKKILVANSLFADMFEIDQEQCRDLPILDILHEESIEMITDYIRRRIHGDADVPLSYTANFRTKSIPKLPLRLTVVKTSKTEGALLVILQKS